MLEAMQVQYCELRISNEMLSATVVMENMVGDHAKTWIFPVSLCRMKMSDTKQQQQQHHVAGRRQTYESQTDITTT
jgi:hypothetical protein